MSPVTTKLSFEVEQFLKQIEFNLKQNNDDVLLLEFKEERIRDVLQKTTERILNNVVKTMVDNGLFTSCMISVDVQKSTNNIEEYIISATITDINTLRKFEITV